MSATTVVKELSVFCCRELGFLDTDKMTFRKVLLVCFCITVYAEKVSFNGRVFVVAGGGVCVLYGVGWGAGW